MKIINSISRICLCFIAVFLTGCAKDKLDKTPNNGAYNSTLVFNVTQSITKAEASAEDDVRRVDIMLFNQGLLEKIMRNITSFESAQGGQSSVKISFETEGTRKAYIIANIDDESWLNTLRVGQTTEDDIKTLRTAVLTNMANPPLVMYGVSEDITFSTGQSTVLCNLYRVVAKIDIHNKSSNFNLKSARLIRSKVSSCIFPGSGSNAGTQIKDFGAESVQTDNVVLYSYENGAEELSKATAVEIKGELNGADMTYTVDLVNQGKVLSLERNYSYTINVNDVQVNSVNASIVVKPWILGDPISEIIYGNKPVVDVVVEKTVGTYTNNDSTVLALSRGGSLVLSVKANAECDIQCSDTWLTHVAQSKAASSIDGSFTVNIDSNPGSGDRVGQIIISNKINGLSQTIIVKQNKGIVVADKYMVIVVAGQSNAVGYDQSPIDAEDLNTPARALQLSYRNGVAPNQNLDIIPLRWCADDVDVRKQNNPNESGQYGLKGIHLPLVKELLKYVPADYNIIVVPVAYASSRFATSGSTYGSYNSISMQPTSMTSWLYWGLQSAYYPTIINRVKSLLDKDENNKFLGVVWCQGENDNANADYHYAEFTKMAEGILGDLNVKYGNRSNYGVIDKRSWYNFSSCNKWVNWYSEADASAVFGGYKVWNPDTFIHVPSDYPINPPVGPGGGDNHFGKNAYRDIAKLVAERMNKNGLLFNGVTPTNKHFADNTTTAQAAAEGGSINDSDVRTSLLLFKPYNSTINEALVGSPAVISSAMTLTAATGLTDINGNQRTRNALSLSTGYLRIRNLPSSVANWSISFMFKRTGNESAMIQSIIAPYVTNSPFIGFRKYSSVMGVARAAEFVVEPNATGTKTTAVPGQFMAADKVGTLNEWVHYAVTYDNTTKETSIYMNGELVQKAVISSTAIANFSNIYIGTYGTYSSAQGQMMDLCIWSKTITPAIVRKMFLMSYYGFTL